MPRWKQKRKDDPGREVVAWRTRTSEQDRNQTRAAKANKKQVERHLRIMESWPGDQLEERRKPAAFVLDTSRPTRATASVAYRRTLTKAFSTYAREVRPRAARPLR